MGLIVLPCRSIRAAKASAMGIAEGNIMAGTIGSHTVSAVA
jgi:hypothetical protein